MNQPAPSLLLSFRMDGVLSPALRKGVNAGKRREMAGWLTTFGHLGPDGGLVPTVDRDGQVFEAARELGRIDWTEYLAKGAWNDTHKEDTVVGRAHSVEFHDGTTALSKAYGGRVGFWTRGELFGDDPESWGSFGKPTQAQRERADHFWELASLLKAVGVPRGLGLSAHGDAALSPDGTKIVWAAIRQAAVCETPKNPAATLEALSKALPDDLLTMALRKGTTGLWASPDALLAKGTDAHAIAPLVPQDLEGTTIQPAGDGQTTRERLIAAMMANHNLTREDAERYLEDFLARFRAERSTRR